MKKQLIIILVLSFALTSCQAGNSGTTSDETENNTAAPTTTGLTAAEPTTAAPTTATPTTAAPTTAAPTTATPTTAAPTTATPTTAAPTTATPTTAAPTTAAPTTATPTTAAPTTAAPTTATPTTAAPTTATPTTEKRVDITFIGNSLTDRGGIPSKFQSLCRDDSRSVSVLDYILGGGHLYHHADNFEKTRANSAEGVETILDKTDIIILQEYGGKSNTSSSITKIINLFNPDVKYYYLYTEFDIKLNRIDTIDDFEEITIIPSGDVFISLQRNGFSKQNLVDSDGYHPNRLYGYAAALTAYSVIYETSCVGLSHASLDAASFELLPGNTKEEKEASILKMQQLVDEIVEEAKDKY